MERMKMDSTGQTNKKFRSQSKQQRQLVDFFRFKFRNYVWYQAIKKHAVCMYVSA